METVKDFVQRTRGPMVPYVASWYPWAYAHHYLRTEASGLPPELGVTADRMSPDAAVDLVQVWCALTGENIQESARLLADAYLARWGVPAVPADVPPPAPPRQRTARTARLRAKSTRATRATRVREQAVVL